MPNRLQNDFVLPGSLEVIAEVIGGAIALGKPGMLQAVSRRSFDCAMIPFVSHSTGSK